ncbi:MAG: acetate--CoA ligase family protein [Gammaproteobacteria bacterium]|uniref:Succinyl-CoA synthetase subunit beta n=1 Tax=Marinobacter litoralis TaxID=187981 RepID=A0A3M2R8I1_9GAMM|nr:acetate--CoA ligase family protein [Marinobacter litoralis]MBR9871693.1 acetate--CoA ligase family protein [Gammaproteobacteria bacterium]RMJ01603.1 succinyl-CoA synthetase subunit beta [Marinobacter litoralis]
MLSARFLHPKSIAVFGGREAKKVIEQCEAVGFTGEIWPVHPKHAEISGRKTYRSVAELPSSPDAAYIAVNRNLSIQIVAELAARDAGGVVCYATGFSESGEDGKELEQQLLKAAGNMPLLGPNCYGFLNYIQGAMMWPDQQGGRQVDRGVALITMSSNIAFNLTMQRRGLPISYLVSLGNRLKFDLQDAITTFAEQDEVTAIGLYVEGITDPRAFQEAAEVARQFGKPIVALKSGHSEVASQVVMSHTAALSGSDELIDALFERSGVARVNSLETLIETLKLLHVHGPLRGARIGAMSTSGGDMTILADAISETELSLAPLSDSGAIALKQVVHERMAVGNPLDYQLFDWGNQERLQITYEAFMNDGFDLAISMLDLPREDRCDASDWQSAEYAFIEASKNTQYPTAVMSTVSDNLPEPLALRLIDRGIVPLNGIQAAVPAIEAAARIGQLWARNWTTELILPSVPTGLSGEQIIDEASAKAALAKHGLAIPSSRIVKTEEEGIAAAEALGYPVVIKALGIAHKTDVGGVRLNLTSPASVADAVSEMRLLAKDVLVEKMVTGAVTELIVGVSRDEQFGLHLVVGAGGIMVELLKDSRPLLLPTSRSEIEAALRSLKTSSLLFGFRGREEADLEAVIDAVMAIAAYAQEHASSLIELDVNPLMVLPKGQGVVAADALIRKSPALPHAEQAVRETADKEQA